MQPPIPRISSRGGRQAVKCPQPEKEVSSQYSCKGLLMNVSSGATRDGPSRLVIRLPLEDLRLKKDCGVPAAVNWIISTPTHLPSAKGHSHQLVRLPSLRSPFPRQIGPLYVSPRWQFRSVSPEIRLLRDNKYLEIFRGRGALQQIL